MSNDRAGIGRRDCLRAAAATGALLGSGCAAPTSLDPSIVPRRYADRPEIMAIGDSLYQGVRSLSFSPGMEALSPPAQVARALGATTFTTPDLRRPLLFDIERLYEAHIPTLEASMLWQNALAWDLRIPTWSTHEAFDNVAVGGALIDSLWLDHADTYWKRFDDSVRKADYPSLGFIFDRWYALNVAFTLNPRFRDEQQRRSQIDQVTDRKPRLLLVNIGSNEGLSSAVFKGDVQGGAASLNQSLPKMDNLARLLAALPPDVERIAFNSLIRPRAATNLMPGDAAALGRPGDGYFDAYGPWLFSADQPVTGAAMRDFDRTVLEYNRTVRDMLERHVGRRLAYVDLYAASDRFDGKHYPGRGIAARGHLLRNVPLGWQGDTFSGGITGLDNLHPTGVGYAAFADSVLAALGRTTVTDKDAVFDRDRLLTTVSPLIDFRQSEVRRLATLVRDLGLGGLGAPPAQLAAMQRS